MVGVAVHQEHQARERLGGEGDLLAPRREAVVGEFVPVAELAEERRER
ncbi:hypothetical protein OVA19_00260 [Streptomyces sp. SL203]|nr:hypothetical protein [Streptomyces sp. SL203]MCY1649255.1 hypothetical protein [Streptomyces sp. SL203]